MTRLTSTSSCRWSRLCGSRMRSTRLPCSVVRDSTARAVLVAEEPRLSAVPVKSLSPDGPRWPQWNASPALPGSNETSRRSRLGSARKRNHRGGRRFRRLSSTRRARCHRVPRARRATLARAGRMACRRRAMWGCRAPGRALTPAIRRQPGGTVIFRTGTDAFA